VTTIGRGTGEFRIGQVLARSFRILGGNFVPLTLICLIATLPVFLPRLFVESHPAMPHQLLRGVSLLLSTFVTLPISYAIFVLVIVQDISSGAANIGFAINQAFRRLLPLIGCVVCQGLAVAGGMILLIIPGLIVLTMLSVGAQACVIERLGPIASLSRSAALTKGLRWRIFGLLLIAGAASTAVSVISNPLQRNFGLPGVIIGFLLTGLATAFYNTVVAVQFYDLRVAKEGIGTERIASVFD